MTFEVLYDSILSKELHVLVHDVTDLPLVIRDPMITEMHVIMNNAGVMNLILHDSEKNFKVTPSEAQASDWIWETSKGEIRFTGMIDKNFAPCEMDFWLTA